MKEHTFRLCLITGASSGIGEALCYLMADQGIDLMISGRDLLKLEALASNITPKVNVEVLRVDLSDQVSRKILVEHIHEKTPDLVINNAGFGIYGNAVSTPVEEQLDILTVNGLAVVEITLESIKSLLKNNRKGIILNVSSAAAFQVFPGFAVYSASKAFVNQFSVSLDYETKAQGIRVLTACPGMVKTGFRKRASKGNSENHEDLAVMEASYAAKEIWHQILKETPIHIFNWRYRLAAFFTRFLLPSSFVARKLYSNITKRTSK